MKYLQILIVAALVAGGVIFYRSKTPVAPGAAAEGDHPARKNTAVVERRSINFSITAAGDIGPAEQVSVRPEVNGVVEMLPVDVGDRVKKDQLLFTLKDKDLQTERASQLIAIERANLQLEKAGKVYARSKQLFGVSLVSLESYESAKNDYDLARNALDSATKQLSILDDQLTKTKILAPFNCTVLTRPVSIGQAVSGSAGFNSGTEVLTIANLEDMIIDAHVNQADVIRLSIGQEVNVQVESVPGLYLKGKVDRISPQTTIRNNVKGYPSRIKLITHDPRVLPGMTGNLSIPVASADNALSVPLAAVFTEQGERYAYVKSGESFEKRQLQLGVYDYDYAEVLSGLNPGEVVSLELPAGEGAPKMTPATKTPAGAPAKTAAAEAPGKKDVANVAAVTNPKEPGKGAEPGRK
jgi:RND family efflux transporter MFP subunit